MLQAENIVKNINDDDDDDDDENENDIVDSDSEKSQYSRQWCELAYQGSG